MTLPKTSWSMPSFGRRRNDGASDDEWDQYNEIVNDYYPDSETENVNLLLNADAEHENRFFPGTAHIAPKHGPFDFEASNVSSNSKPASKLSYLHNGYDSLDFSQ